jgi:hypothetical protein
VKNEVLQFKRKISVEKSDFLSALNEQEFFSSSHAGPNQILGESSCRSGKKISVIANDDQIGLIWSEYLRSRGTDFSTCNATISAESVFDQIQEGGLLK